MKILAVQKLKSYLPALALVIFFVPGFTFAAPSAEPSTVVIDEFQVAGESTSDEYVVVANYGTDLVNLNTFKLMKYSASAKSSAVLYSSFGDFKLMPNSKVMICSDGFTGERLAKTFEYIYSTSKTISDNNSIVLLNGDTVIDTVGYRDDVETTITYFEGTPITPGPNAKQICKRTNGTDTTNNNADFTTAYPPVSVDPNAGKLVISEILPNPETGDEWFELYNPTSQSVSLANLKICDALGRRHCYRFATDSVIVAESYLFYEQPITKITLNNDGDWLELYDGNGELLTTSGEDFGEADNGIALALFGSKYEWTATPTPGEQNIYTDTIEIEKTTTAKTKKSTAKKTASSVVPSEIAENVVSTETQETPKVTVNEEAAETLGAETKAPVNNRVLGWVLVGLAFLLVVGYICWAYGKIIYDKIKSRDDSTRF